MSVADILAAARGGGAPSAKAETSSAKVAPPQSKTAEAAETAPAAKPAATKVDVSKMSVADILAAARGGGAAAAGAQAPAAATPSAKSAPEAPAAPTAPPAAQQVDASKMSVAEILAAARGQASSPAATPAAIHSAPEVTAETAAPPSPTKQPSDVTMVASKSERAATDETPLPTATADIIAYCRKRDG
jgi:hypothetical protein